MSLSARQIVDAMLGGHTPIKAADIPPPHLNTGDDEGDIEMATRSPWNAHELAHRTGRHHPKLWQTVKGSPFEQAYRRRFNPQ